MGAAAGWTRDANCNRTLAAAISAVNRAGGYHPSVLRAVLFDFNGVLVDDEPLHLELFQRVAGEEGIELGEKEYYAEYLGFDDRGAFNAILAAAGRRPEAPAIARLIARKASYYRDLVRQRGYPFFPGAAELVAAVARRGLRLGVVSGALRDEVLGALDDAGLAEKVELVIAAEDVAEGKPHPEGYLRAVERLNSKPPLPDRLIHPHEVLAIEDSPAGLESAAGAGLRTLGVAHTYPAERLTSASAVVASLAEIDVDGLDALVG